MLSMINLYIFTGIQHTSGGYSVRVGHGSGPPRIPHDILTGASHYSAASRFGKLIF